MDRSENAQGARVNDRQGELKAVDLWVKRSLTADYASVLREPLPEAWLALLQKPTSH